MFILFGWGHQTLKNHGQIYKVRCGCCNRIEQFYLYTKRTWFTLFFIPIIPYETLHMIICPACSNGGVIDNNQFQGYKSIIQCNIDLQNQIITNGEYEERIKLINTEYFLEHMADITDVGRNYLRCIEEYEKQKAEKNSMSAE